MRKWLDVDGAALGKESQQVRSKRDGEGSGSESEPAPAPSPAELSSEEEEFAESQQAGARVLERAEELEKIKKQQRETGEGLAAFRQLPAALLLIHSTTRYSYRSRREAAEIAVGR